MLYCLDIILYTYTYGILCVVRGFLVCCGVTLYEIHRVVSFCVVLPSLPYGPGQCTGIF